MEGVRKAYNEWAEQYDTNKNRTRDLEAKALRSVLAKVDVHTCLEIGCGTGKNTSWLIEKAKTVLAVDLSEGMLAMAKSRIASPNVTFMQADINQPWQFTSEKFDLITFSLVLEHIEHLDKVFAQVAEKIKPKGFLYIGELHPFKQYQGTKARFETAQGTQVVPCFDHHVSDYFTAAATYGFRLITLAEWFDDDDRSTTPRILTLLLARE